MSRINEFKVVIKDKQEVVKILRFQTKAEALEMAKRLKQLYKKLPTTEVITTNESEIIRG